MKQKEINLILSNNAATSDGGDSFVNLRILDVGELEHERAACEMYPHSYWSVNHKMPSTAQIYQKYKVSVFLTPASC